MNDTLLGVLIGGLISLVGLVPSIIQIILSYRQHKEDIHNNKKLIFREEQIKAYKVLLKYINEDADRKKIIDTFDFYYYDVLPYVSYEVKTLIDEYYMINFETEAYLKGTSLRDMPLEWFLGRNINKINEQIRKEFREILY